MNETGNPQEALSAARAAQVDMVRRATGQGWYHWSLGLLMGGLTMVQAAPVALRLPLIGAVILGLGLLVHAYRRRTGVWVSGLRPGGTLGIALAMGLVVALGQAASFSAWLNGGAARGLPIAVAVFVIVTALGYAWDAVYRADMGVSGGRGR